jgi:hypothetical protein
LNNALVEGNSAIHRRKNAERSLTSDVRALDCRPVLQHGQQRKNAALWEIDMVKLPTRFANDSAKLEDDGLQFSQDSAASSRLESAQQLVLMENFVGLGLLHIRYTPQVIPQFT